MKEKFTGKRKWFPEAKFGMFVHFGLYTIMGKNENSVRNISKKRYAAYMKKFNPVEFNAEEWIQLAVDSGAKYITPTMKHAEGFCLWNSELTKHKITNTPFGRDILAELNKACDRKKLKLCVYYNPENWLYDGSDIWSERGMSYPEFVEGQLREILTRYGEIGMIWFDHANPDLPPSALKKIIAIIHDLQPSCVVNNRSAYDNSGQGFGRIFHGDFVTPERFIPEPPRGKHPFIECCDATGVSSWGYCENEAFWSAPELIRRLSKCSSIGANYLLNVEPMLNGKIRPDCVERMLAVGRWLENNGEAVFKTERCDVVPLDSCGEGNPALGVSTINTKEIYLHLHSWPAANEIRVTGIKGDMSKCAMLNTKKKQLRAKRSGNSLIISDLPPEPPENSVSIVRMKFSDVPVISRTAEACEKKVVDVLKDETIHLIPEDAERRSPNNICWHRINRFPDGRTSIGSLFRHKPIIIWLLDVEETGNYAVFVELGAMESQSDATFSIECGESKVQGITWNTGHYSKPERHTLDGRLHLNKGRQKVVFNISERPHGHFADIYRIILQPLRQPER